MRVAVDPAVVGFTVFVDGGARAGVDRGTFRRIAEGAGQAGGGGDQRVDLPDIGRRTTKFVFAGHAFIGHFQAGTIEPDGSSGSRLGVVGSRCAAASADAEGQRTSAIQVQAGDVAVREDARFNRRDGPNFRAAQAETSFDGRDRPGGRTPQASQASVPLAFQPNVMHY